MQTTKQMGKSILLSLAFFSVLAANAQTADEIVSKNLEAMGGKDKIGQIKSLYTEGTMQMMGNDNPTATTILNGKGIRMDAEFNGQKIVQVITDNGGWMINPMMGGGTPQPMPEEMYKASKEQLYVGGPFYNYAAHGTKIELLGKDAGLYKLKVTTSDGNDATYYIDPTTYYINKVEKKGQMQGQDMEITISLSDYQKTDNGFMVPRTVLTDMGGGFQMTANVKKVVVNKEVDPKIFEMPKN